VSFSSQNEGTASVTASHKRTIQHSGVAIITHTLHGFPCC